MRRAGIVASLGVATLLVIGISGWWWLNRSGSGSADPTNLAQVEYGRQLYAVHCASCHGAALEGQPDWRTRKPDGKLPAPPHDESGHTWHHPDGVLFGITRDGLMAYAPRGYQSDMPAFKDRLSDAEIWSVLAFIKSTWPPTIQSQQAEMERPVDR